MFERIGRLAERAATGVSVSRRDFFGSLGRWAGAAALGVAGLLVPGKEAQAGHRTPCCLYNCPGGGRYQLCSGAPCTPTYGACFLSRTTYVGNCNQCPTGFV